MTNDTHSNSLNRDARSVYTTPICFQYTITIISSKNVWIIHEYVEHSPQLSMRLHVQLCENSIQKFHMF